MALVAFWAIRLTMNWLRSWHGLADEDWRYADYRRLGAGTGRSASSGSTCSRRSSCSWDASPCCPAFLPGSRQFGILDLLAIVVTLGAILIGVDG